MVRMIRWCTLLLALPAIVGCSGSGPSKVRGAEVRTPTNRPPSTIRPSPETDLDDDVSPIGVTVEPPAYRLVADTRKEYFRVSAGAFSGLLDRFGQELVPPRYHEILDYDSPPNRWFLVVNGWMKSTNTMWGGRWGLLDSRGRVVVPPRFDHLRYPRDERILFQEGDRFGYLDTRGKVAIPARFQSAKSFSEGLACVNVGGRPRYSDWNPEYVLGGKWGFVDTAGRWRVPPKLDDCTVFRHGRAPVQINCTEDPNSEYERHCHSGKWGLLDPEGHWILKPQWSRIKFLDDEANDEDAARMRSAATPRFLVCQKCSLLGRNGCVEACGAVDANGRTIVPKEYADMERIGDRLLVRDLRDRYGVFTVDGKLEVMPEWNHQQADRWRERQSMTTTPTPPRGPRRLGRGEDYNWDFCVRSAEPDILLGRPGRACHTLARLPSGAWVCRDPRGRTTALPGVRRAGDFNGRFAPVQVGGRWGFINAAGQMAVAPTLELDRIFPRLCDLSLARDAQGRDLFFYEMAGRIGTVTVDGKLEPAIPSPGQPEASGAADELATSIREGWDDPSWRSQHNLESNLGAESDTDETKEQLTEKYDTVEALENGRFLVTQTKLQGLADSLGRLVIPLKNQEILDLGDTFVGVCQAGGRCDDPRRGSWRLMRLDGQPAGTKTFTGLKKLADGFIAFRRPCPARGHCRPDAWGILDRDGDVSFDAVLEEGELEERWHIEMTLGTPEFSPEKTRQATLVDARTSKVLPERFDHIEQFLGDRFWVNEGCTWKHATRSGWKCVGGRWGLWKPGRGFLHPHAFEAVLDQTGPWATVGIGCVIGKYGRTQCRQQGVVDLTGKVVVPVKYRNVETEDSRDMDPASCHRKGAVEAGTVVVSDDSGKRGLVDLSGQVVVPLQYDHVCPPQHGVARVSVTDDRSPNRLYGAWGLVALGGRLVLPTEYGYISDFRGKVARINQDGYCTRSWSWSLRCRGGRWGLVRPDGTFVLAPQFDWIAPFENGRARTEQRPRFGLLRVGPVK